MKRKDVDTFEKLFGQLQGVYDELSILSKKSPTDAVNTFKLKFVNQLLKDANDHLGESYRPFKEFTEFDSDDVPQNSDVVFILAQYLQCLDKFRADNVKIHHGNWCWMVDAENGDQRDEDGLIYIKTTNLKRLSK
jgi:hypothetical protein